jgi:hypothetical protein
MKVELPNIKDTTWPLMTIEFEALRDKKFEGNFEVGRIPHFSLSFSLINICMIVVRRSASKFYRIGGILL